MTLNVEAFSLKLDLLQCRYKVQAIVPVAKNKRQGEKPLFLVRRGKGKGKKVEKIEI